MRVKHKVNVVITEDTTAKNALFAPDDELAAVTLDGQTEQSSGHIALAALGTFTVPLGGLADARGCFLKATGDFDLVVNGGDTLQVRRAQSHATDATIKASTTRFFFEGVITSLEITAVEALTLSYAVWGDPVA